MLKEQTAVSNPNSRHSTNRILQRKLISKIFTILEKPSQPVEMVPTG